MDERLAAGRHHLLNGERALQQGYPSDSRAHFESALVQFRGPDLRLGEAHALRGLAQVDLADGDPTQAEKRLRKAIDAYQAIYPLLEQLDTLGLSQEMRRDAQEGEAAALVLLSELMMRVGDLTQARTALAYAREVYEQLGPLPSSATAWAATARLALRENHPARALEAFARALATYESSGNVAGQVGIWLSIAEVKRIERDPLGAEDALAKARPLAKQARSAGLEARALSALGSLLVQQLRLREARAVYLEALPLAREAADRDVEGLLELGLGDAESRIGMASAMEHLVSATRRLGGAENHHGFATGLLRIGEHGLRMGATDLALVAGEGARREFQKTDPVRGVGYAWRVIVKALAAQRDGYGVLVTAIARETIAGSQQQNARDVADYYRKRAPQEWIDELRLLGVKGTLDRAKLLVEGALSPILTRLSIDGSALNTSNGCLGVIEVLAPQFEAPMTAGEDFAEATPGPATLEDVPPEEEVPLVLVASALPASVVIASISTPYDGYYDPPDASDHIPGGQAVITGDRIPGEGGRAELWYLAGTSEQRVYTLIDDTVWLGRSRENGVQLRVDGKVSKRHCSIIRRGNEFFVEDNDSEAGTLVNGEKVVARKLESGDLLTLGDTRLEFRVSPVTNRDLAPVPKALIDAPTPAEYVDFYEPPTSDGEDGA